MWRRKVGGEQLNVTDIPKEAKNTLAFLTWVCGLRKCRFQLIPYDAPQSELKL